MYVVLIPGSDEGRAQGHPEGDGDVISPEAAPDHRHDDDVGSAAVRNQRGRFNIYS